MISQDLKDRLSELKDAYECCYNETVTYDQMLARWASQVKRFDPQVAAYLTEMRERRKMTQVAIAEGLGITAEQLTENEPWNLRYFFDKDGEQLPAILGEQSPFYMTIDGDMEACLMDGWTLQNEIGVELDIDQAWKINRLIKDKDLVDNERSRREIKEGKGIEVDVDIL